MSQPIKQESYPPFIPPFQPDFVPLPSVQLDPSLAMTSPVYILAKISSAPPMLATPDAVPTNSYYLLVMDRYMRAEFDRLFAQYFPHHWSLEPTSDVPQGRWRLFKDSAKVRFSCKSCGHAWTSMKGRVIFWFTLNHVTGQGHVKVKLYGQQCQQCRQGQWEDAMWYPEEVEKVVGNIYNRVGQVFYGFHQPPLDTARREGKPRNKHNSDLCQACKDGLCKGEWLFY